MPTTRSRVGGTDAGGNQPVQISAHARDRWASRTPAESSLESAWAAALPVEAPAVAEERVRLYPPYDVLLVVRRGMLRTILNRDGPLAAPGLHECDACGDLVDPVPDASCPWCGAELGETIGAGPGTVTLTWGDD